jgi:hypothetical protein
LFRKDGDNNAQVKSRSGGGQGTIIRPEIHTGCFGAWFKQNSQ